MKHIPVLLNESIGLLDPKPGEFFIDGTIDGGGHATEIFKKILPEGKLLGIDLDKNFLETTRLKISTELKIKNGELRNNLILINGNYANLPKILKKNELPKADGLLLDLGMSSEQLDSPVGESGRGFSFLRDEPLIMRYAHKIQNSPKENKFSTGQAEFRIKNYLTAAEVINSFSEKELGDIIWKFGEERFSRKIAKSIVEERKKERILTVFQLVEAIKKSVPKGYQNRKIHPATKTFQALRIYVNNELENLENLLKNLEKILKDNGRATIISFHSLEDGLVKNYFRNMVKNKKARYLNKKPIVPAREEIILNPRSRSAKLRAIIIKYDNSSAK